MELIVIGVWLVCGILCAVVADAKGRSVPGWLVTGLLPGILGLIAIAGMPALERPAQQPVRHRTNVGEVIAAAVSTGVLIGFLVWLVLA